MSKVSVYVIAYNEENKIDAALASVTWADEILVADSFSTDRTLEIARRYTDRVVQLPFEGFGKLRNDAIAHTRNEWIFSLDADERCTPGARDEILGVVSDPGAADAYFIPRRNLFLGRWIRHSGWYPDYRQPQLFRRDALRYKEEPVHEGYVVTGRTGYLRQAILQEPFADLSQLIAKINRYSTLGARKLEERQSSAGMGGALAHAVAAFLKPYVFQLGFLDGWPGFVIALSNFEATFYKYAKRAEAARSGPREGK
jgi:glycosyltransferase involved in cell wall biosynthesis